MSLRRTALKRKSELRRSAPIRRGQIARAARVKRTIDSKRRPRHTGPTPETRRLVAVRAGYRCELCGMGLYTEVRGWFRAHSFHHRQPRGMGGTRRAEINTPPNILLVCGTGDSGCHGLIESRRTDAYANGWLVRSGQDSAAVAVQLEAGLVLLTRDGGFEVQP